MTEEDEAAPFDTDSWVVAFMIWGSTWDVTVAVKMYYLVPKRVISIPNALTWKFVNLTFVKWGVNVVYLSDIYLRTLAVAQL
jgi:hypothetical protein